MLIKNSFVLIYLMVEFYFWKKGGLKLEICLLLQQNKLLLFVDYRGLKLVNLLG